MYVGLLVAIYCKFKLTQAQMYSHEGYSQSVASATWSEVDWSWSTHGNYVWFACTVTDLSCSFITSRNIYICTQTSEHWHENTTLGAVWEITNAFRPPPRNHNATLCKANHCYSALTLYTGIGCFQGDQSIADDGTTKEIALSCWPFKKLYSGFSKWWQSKHAIM